MAGICFSKAYLCRCEDIGFLPIVEQVSELSVFAEKHRVRLSVLIPVHDQRVVELAAELCRQGWALGEPFEVRCLDDGSQENWKNENRALIGLEGCVYGEVGHNIGRAAIRNRLAEEARGEFLLFLDGDASVEDLRFLSEYLSSARPDGVVCGVKKHRAEPPSPAQRLHWLYGSRRESLPARERQQRPYHAFNSFSFLLPRELFLTVRLDESLRGYGHEDTLFGLELRARSIPVLHTDIGAWHEGIDQSLVFLQKNRAAVGNLLLLSARFPALESEVKLLRVYAWVRRLRLAAPLRWLYCRFQGRIEAKLLSSAPRLWVLDLYKLGEILGRG